MLESLVSSRIRRTLLEHLVKNPAERFYLRGLAKALRLPITPLRRELKRLEAAGMLRAMEEGNILFYTVETASATFHQLQQAMLEAPAAPPASAVAAPVLGVATPIAARRRSPAPALLIAVTALGLLMMGSMATATYMAMTNERALGLLGRFIRRSVDVAVVTPPAAAGTMRGRHWQIVPGGFGGFSAGDAK